jgi:hypothetical protein
MGSTIAFLQSLGIALLFFVISSNLARYGIMAPKLHFKISPVMPSGPTDFFFPIAYKRLLIMSILMVKGLPNSVDLICGLLHSQQNRDV